MTGSLKLDATTKAAVLLEALPYIQQFHQSIFVVKYGGAFMDDADPAVRVRVATDIVFLSTVGIKVVVVHGGGKAITRALEKSKLQTRFEQGLRVTDQNSIKVVEHTLNEIVNPSICSLLKEKGARPAGLAGNNILQSNKKQVLVDGVHVDVGYVGEIHSVNTEAIHYALDDGYIPVISPIASDANGQIYNTNADAAAAQIAAVLGARRLVYLCDVPGLMKDINDSHTLISSMRSDEVEGLIKDGTISKGMIPKTESAVKALNSGVHRVHFVAGESPHSLLLEIFTDKGVGTEIVSS